VILALEQAGVLREVDDEEEYPGPGRPARRWQVNPVLLAKPVAQIAEKKTSPSSKEVGADPPTPVPSAAQADPPSRVPAPAPVQAGWPK